MGRWWIELVQYNLLENFKMMRKLHITSRQNFGDGKDLCSFPILTSDFLDWEPGPTTMEPCDLEKVT